MPQYITVHVEWFLSLAALLTALAKGQLISECSLDLLNFPKKNNEKFDKFLPWNLSDQIIKIKANSYT